MIKIDTKLLISTTSISMFLQCKRKYRYKYINKIRAAPTKSKYLSFGTSVHNSLSKFTTLDSEEQNYLTLSKILDENWINDGYENSEEIQDNLERAKNMLDIYCSERKDVGTTLLSEEMIFNNINPLLTVCGKIDRVFINNDSKIELLDYKTGEKTTFLIDINSDIQLPIYIVLLKYRLNIVPDVISYYYLSSNTKVSLDLDRDSIIQCVNRLKSLITVISNESTFSPTPNPSCKFCEYLSFCDVFNKNISL